MLADSTDEPLLGHRVPVVRAEGLIGLKVQAYTNDPSRQLVDRADILSLLRVAGERMNLAQVADYFALFGKSADWEELRAFLG